MWVTVNTTSMCLIWGDNAKWEVKQWSLKKFCHLESLINQTLPSLSPISLRKVLRRKKGSKGFLACELSDPEWTREAYMCHVDRWGEDRIGQGPALIPPSRMHWWGISGLSQQALVLLWPDTI